jgi:glycosyltransferase involved in cell wall biosynthesis
MPLTALSRSHTPHRRGQSQSRASTRPLRICLISPLGYGLYHPEAGQRFGGSEVQLYLLARELSNDAAFQVSVLTTVSREAQGEVLSNVRLLTRVGRGRLGANGEGTMQGYLSAFAEMHRTLAAIDADLYVHAGAGVEVGAYALICRLLRRRFIFVVASTADLLAAPPNVRGPLRWAYRLGLRLADAIVCRSEDQAATLRDQWHRRGCVIRSGHPLAELAEPEAAKSTILWVGRMHPLKQPALFLQLAARFPRERFVMVASGDIHHGELQLEIRRQARERPNLFLIEDVPWTEVGRYFDEAKLLINTSTYEGFPNTFVQAALREVPILSWAVNPDQVLTRHGIGGCAGASFERLVEMTRQLCADEPLRTEMGRRAAAYAREAHDLSRTTEQFKQLMRTVAARRR